MYQRDNAAYIIAHILSGCLLHGAAGKNVMREFWNCCIGFAILVSSSFYFLIWLAGGARREVMIPQKCVLCMGIIDDSLDAVSRRRKA
jgi:hypothetical protein